MAHPSHGFPEQPLSDTSLCFLHSLAQHRDLPKEGQGSNQELLSAVRQFHGKATIRQMLFSNPADPAQWKHRPGAARKAAACLQRAQVAAQASQLSVLGTRTAPQGI